MTTATATTPIRSERAFVVTSTRRVAGIAAIAGGACMLIGAALWAASGADLDAALADGTMSEYLVDAASSTGLLVANLSFWIVGVTLIAIAGTALTAMDREQGVIHAAARTTYLIAAPVAIAAFTAWLALVRIAGNATTSPALAESLGFFASRADWIATVLLIGFGPLLVAMAGRETWVPKWLARWSRVAAGAGLLTVVAMYTDQLSSYGFLIVPIGIGWTIAAGIVALRSTS